MNKPLLGVLAILGLGSAAAVALLATGRLDVAADTPHNPTVHRLIEWARERAIERQAGAVDVPADLGDAERARRGAGNYAAMCAGCHLAPGVRTSEMHAGLYPTPPNLAAAAGDSVPPEQLAARRFWIIKHGIKASGMPAWAKGGMDDAAIWDVVAFLGGLPRLTPAEYRQRVAASDGHAHGGIEPTAAAPSPAPAHDHKGHTHAKGQNHAH